jgi:predicted dehydrogenase
LRAAPLYQWLRRAIASGDLGDVYAIDGDYLYGRLDKITAGWRRDVDNYSVVQGGGVHLVDLILWLTQERPASVMAAGNRVCTAGTAYRYNDFVAATLTFPSGLLARITANFGCVHRHQHVLRVFGTRGTFIYDDAGARLHTSRDPAVPATALANLSPLPASKGDLIPPFVDAIVAGSNGREAAQHEFDVISVCVAADAAVAASQPIAVEYV